MSKTRDPFDEFEFKPLTEGLGFHKKSIDLGAEVKKTGLATPPAQADIPTFDDLLDEPTLGRDMKINDDVLGDLTANPLEKDYIQSFTDNATSISNRPEIKKPLPRSEKESSYTALNNVETKLDLNFDEETVKAPSLDKEILQVQDRIEYKKIPTAIFASIFDSVVAFTLSIVFMVAMMSVIKVDLLGLLLNAETQLITQLSFLGMYLAILQLYVVIARSVAKCTLGEWAFDIHLAQRSGSTGTYFPLLVIWRGILMMATGFVLLPLLSFITRRDIASYFTGTQLFQLK